MRRGLALSTWLPAFLISIVSLVGLAHGLQRSFLSLYNQHGVDIVVVIALGAGRARQGECGQGEARKGGTKGGNRHGVS